MHGMIFQGYNQ